MNGYNPGFDFEVDLQYGENGERLLQEIFRGGTKVEVKRDRKAKRTKNIAVETDSHGKKSGINVTTSNWWAHIVEDSPDGSKPPRFIILIPTARLRVIAKRVKDRDGKVKAGNGNQCIVVPIQDLL